MNLAQKTAFVRKEALRLGFEAVGIARADHLPEEADFLRKWLDAGFHGEMKYLENHFELRTDPRKLVPGARTVLTFLFNYYTDKEPIHEDAPRVSKYAYGKDYHKVLRKKLEALLLLLRQEIGVMEGRVFVDSGPVLERAWAARSGLGWIGKNTLLISPGKGSFFFLSELIIDAELIYDKPVNDHCGRCRLCIDACPTGAISEQGYVMDGSKCISYATIEKKGAIPEFFRKKMKNRVFGCDICLDVCPWNRKFARPHQETQFEPNEALLQMNKREWSELDEYGYEKLFNGTPVRRAKYSGLRRNIDFLDSEGKE